MVDILIVEDNEELGTLVAEFLVKDGYTVKIAGSGEQALSFLKEDSTRLLLLDIMLPGIDGFAVCAAVRKHGTVPILIMSAVVDKEQQMKGFDLGADEYIEKPFDIDILRAKVRAIMKRSYQLREQNQILNAGDLSVDLDARRFYHKGEPIELNGKEYELLLLLVRNAGKTMNKDYLFGRIWGEDSFSENQTLTVHIKRLRNKIEPDAKNPIHIKTIWGVGYKFEEV